MLLVLEGLSKFLATGSSDKDLYERSLQELHCFTQDAY
jgi:hypothetical protein